MCQIAPFSKQSEFCDYQCNFCFLLRFLFVWLIYYTFCYVISLIYWFLNRVFHETLIDQSFGKPRFWQNFVVSTYIQASDFCCSKVSYCKPTFIINCKLFLPVVPAPLQHNDVILMLLWHYNNEFISFLLHFLFCYIVLVLVFPIDISFYDFLDILMHLEH